ncbi:ribonuclease E [bacterium BMS3Bbin14]|nr:ribonuclease E [bacterium BMS3Abin13]GBE51616.1 ribonuclease E [bacterium BMS3Bbin14]HDK43949.1 Rne/Rng family ribonuclease [Desulfobacteraceae bacterium]HDL98729.1 Rne/Rng family ribonuclease [Desulfobacteraceae bacterium]HDO30392.1 Rne/Rng family ribonuclease [Desulfobacteraceae bacterium]
MTEEKDKPTKNEAKQDAAPKVSTGAWWKSTLNLFPKKKPASSGKNQEKPEKKEKQKKQETLQNETAAETAAPAKSAPAPDSDNPQPAAKRPPRPSRSRGRRPRRTTEKDSTAPKTDSDAKPREKGKTRQTPRKKAADKNEEGTKEEPVRKAKRGEHLVTKLLINAEEPEECRIALVENGRLESFHVAGVTRERTKNNIYKGRIVSVEANLQAAFVEIGTDRNGFLPFDEIHPEYYRQDVDDRVRKLIEQQEWKKLKIENVIQRGQEVLVQVVKEVTGNKGANMTTYLSIPGRYLILMPGSDSAGISRKINGDDRRHSLREMMNGFNIPEGIGYIVRTASSDITKTALQKDLQYLLRLWEEIKKKGQEMNTPALIYKDQDIVVRFLRDHFVPDIEEILVDTQESFDQVQQFVSLLPAKARKIRVKLYCGDRPLFNHHNVEEQIESIYQPQVQLPSGGSIVIDPTEALVAIDVNSGRTSKDHNFDQTIFLANMEAAAELARQLRLRDLGGLIVVDFIDMRNSKHIREVEKQVKTSMKRDKAKVDISRISRFGLMQISRQKMGAPIEKGSYKMCEYCQGRGVVKSVETLALYYLRRIQTGITRRNVKRVECSLPHEVAQYLLNKKRVELTELEAKHNAKVDIIIKSDMKPGDNRIDFQE